VRLGAEFTLCWDAAPQLVIRAQVSFLWPTLDPVHRPKTVENGGGASEAVVSDQGTDRSPPC